MRAERYSHTPCLSPSTIRNRSFRSGPRHALVCVQSKVRNGLCGNTMRMHSWRTRTCSQKPFKSSIQESMACSPTSDTCDWVPDPNTRHFWNSSDCWGRASLNTTRCLVGCSLGDLSCMYLLQPYVPEVGMPRCCCILLCWDLHLVYARNDGFENY